MGSIKENVLPTLTAQQKKISIVVSLALAFLAACYVAYYVVSHYCFKGKITSNQEDAPNNDKKEDLVPKLDSNSPNNVNIDPNTKPQVDKFNPSELTNILASKDKIRLGAYLAKHGKD